MLGLALRHFETQDLANHPDMQGALGHRFQTDVKGPEGAMRLPVLAGALCRERDILRVETHTSSPGNRSFAYAAPGPIF